MLKVLRTTVLLVFFVFTGCDGESSSSSPNVSTASKEPTVTVFLYNAQDVYLAGMLESLKAELAGKYTVIVEDGRNDQITQNEQLDTILAQGVDAVLYNPVEPQASSLALDLAQKANVPIIFFNREPNLDVLKTYSKAAFVGTAVFDAGKLQGEIIRDIWREHPEFDRNGDGKFQFVMFQGEPDNPEAIARTEYSIKSARELGVQMEQVGQTNISNWDRKTAHEAMKLVLAASFQEVELVVANNDTMALGAIDALQEIGYNQKHSDKTKFIPVVGVDAIADAVDAIRSGIMSATVKQDGDAMAKAIAELTINACEKRDFLEGTEYSWDDSGVAVRIPYSKFKLE